MKCALTFKQSLNNMLHFGIELICKQRTCCAEEIQKKLAKNCLLNELESTEREAS